MPRQPIEVKLMAIRDALMAYKDDHLETLPEAFGDLVPKYLKDPEALLMKGIPVVPDPDPPTCFVYIPYSTKAPRDTIIVYPNCLDQDTDYSVLAVLQLDGAVIFMPETEFDQVVRSGRTGRAGPDSPRMTF